MRIFDKIRKDLDVNGNFDQLTLGQVVDTNDPQQMGRVRVACPFFGDTPETIIEDIPWATPISPLAGSAASISRGRGDVKSGGYIAYGMFNVPKVTSYVLVGCLEGDPRFRIYLGGMHDQFLPHTLPHGRYTYKKNDDLTDEPSGPLSSTENRIQPLYDSQTEAFLKRKEQQIVGGTDELIEPRKNFEYRTRAADHGVGGVNNKYIGSEDNIYTDEPDDSEQEFTEPDGNVIENTHGYRKNRVTDKFKSSETGFLYDPQIYSWTTPGFHSVSMHDGADNCRIRIRSTHGHQIIMDDTNERVYISTALGKTWIELDEKGNIDIYGERNISVHAEKDINFTAGGTFRVKAKEGIHMISENEIRMHAKAGNLHLKSGGTTELHSVGDMSMSFPNLFLTATTDIHIKASAGILNLESGSVASIKASTSLNLESGSGGMNLLSAGQILQTGSAIHLNGPGAASAIGATSSTPSNTFDAWWTNRIPEHEPWARMMTDPTKTDADVDNTHTDSGEYSYNDPDVGRIERGETLNRNPKWHR